MPSLRSTARRRGYALGALIALPAILIALGVWQAWPFLAVPMALGIPLGGLRGFGGAATVSALAFALAAGEAAEGSVLAGAWIAFFAIGLAVGVGSDARAKEVRRVAEQSLVDRLTGLHNYAYFADALPMECQRARRHHSPLSLVIFDLDDFKAFNDEYGHDAGNRLLAMVGQVLASERRRSEIAVRYGGEEFALVVLGSAANALVAAERIRAAVARLRVPVAGGEWAGTTMSAGAAAYDPMLDDESGSGMVEAADRALYASKNAGRDRVTLAPETRSLAA